MNRLHQRMLEAFHALEDLGHPAALLGGLAVSAWVEPRFTRDVDLAVSVDADNTAVQLVYLLRQRGYEIQGTVEQEATGRLSTARLIPPGEKPGQNVVDLLFSSSGIEPEIVRAARKLDIGADEPVPVARPGHLVALKLLSFHPRNRPKDGLDLQALREVLDRDEIQLARDACALIVQRGYHRRKPLRDELEAWLASEYAAN